MIAPKLRFKADDGSAFPDWEEKKINDIATCFAGATPSTKIPEYWEDGTIQWMSSGEVNNGQIFETEKRISKLGFDKCSTKMVKPNTVVIALAGQGKTRGMVAITRTSLCTNQSLCAIETNTDICDDYLYQYLQLQYNNLRLISSGDGTRGGLNLKLIGNYSVSIPSLSEQQKIADFLSTIDTIIEKQRATVSAWEERKKGVMQKLFSQEVRFKADDGSDFPDWEEKSFVNTFDSLNNSTFSRDCLNYENGSVKYIHYGDILVKYNSSVDVCDAIVPFVNEDLDCERFAILQDGDIVIADTAEDDTVGKVIEIENTSNVKTIAGLHTIACRPKEKFASKYLGYYMNSDEYHNQLRPYMQGIKVTSISKSNIALTKIMVPSLPEQQKIADCLSALDTVIQKQKETLEKWQELKKGLLQQMFV